MASKKVLSIEVGSKFTRIIEVDYKTKTPKVYHALTIDTPEGVSNDGVLNITSEFVKKVKDKLAKNGIKSKKAIFTIASTKIASREILIPKVKENRIGPLVMANASDYFPVDLSQYNLAYYMLEVVKEETGEEKYKIMVLAIMKSMVDAYEKFAKECGLSLIALDYSGNSVYQMVKKECSTDVSMVVKVDGRCSMITILDHGNMVMQRTISYGLDPVIECYRNYEAAHFSYHQVLKVLEEHSYFAVDSTDVGALYDGVSLADLLVESFAYSLWGISRIYDYYNSRNPGKQVNKIYVTGMGAGVNGLTSYLNDRLGVEVKNISLLGEYHFDKKMSKNHANRYIACLGAIQAPLGFIGGWKEKENKDTKEGGSGNNYAVRILAACVAASLVLLILGVVPYIKERGQKNKNCAKVEELSTIIPVYQKYVQMKNADNYLNAAYEQTLLPTDSLVQFVEEMETKMPRDLYIISFSANKEGVAFSMVASTKQQAADALLKLRTFESLVNIKVNEITDGKSEGQEGAVTFSVSADYVNGKKNSYVENNESVVEEADILE